MFHLLIDEAVGNWRIVRQRSILARTIDHGRMRKVCEDYVKQFAGSGSPSYGLQLNNVASTFVLLQQERHTADYDSAVYWSRSDAIGILDLARTAFSDWRDIRMQDPAQDFLLQLFLPKLPRQ